MQETLIEYEGLKELTVEQHHHVLSKEQLFPRQQPSCSNPLIECLWLLSCEMILL
jgi:hypothetical protein